ncbi:hypothetical protein ACLX1H_007161 [Fusarium chlamydosporum]
MSTLISEHKEHVPNVIYRLLGSIIHARSLGSSTFQQLIGPDSDEELKRSNQSHQHFIDTLRRAFEILGGQEWEKTHATTSDDAEDVEQILFTNKFERLKVDEDEEPSDEEDDDLSKTPAVARKVKYKKPKKGKKQDTRDTAINEEPIESIRIIEDGDEFSL